MTDLTNPRVIKLKGALFLFAGILSAGLLLWETLSLRNLFLLLVCIWSFCRAYYFAFYVIEHYMDPSYRFSGLGAFIHYIYPQAKTENPGH